MASPRGEQSKSTSPAPANRRRARRDTLVARAELWEASSPQPTRPRSVWVCNISTGGLAFRSQRSVNALAVHFLRLCAGPLSLSRQIRITHCHLRDDGSYEIGAQFIADSGLPSPPEAGI